MKTADTQRVRRDRTGREIMEGDLVRTPHYIGARGKQFWLYHGVVKRGDELWGVPISELSGVPAKGGTYPITVGSPGMIEGRVEILSGHGPIGGAYWHDRPRVNDSNNSGSSED